MRLIEEFFVPYQVTSFVKKIKYCLANLRLRFEMDDIHRMYKSILLNLLTINLPKRRSVQRGDLRGDLQDYKRPIEHGRRVFAE